MAEAVEFPIQLKQVYFTRVIVESIPEHAEIEDSGSLKFPPVNTINVFPVPEIENEFMVQMTTVLNPDKNPIDPYFIEVECIALFQFNGITKEEAHRGVTITGHSVAYGAIRETILWITGRQPYGPVALGLSVIQPKKPDENIAQE